jgi:hypothetical protein
LCTRDCLHEPRYGYTTGMDELIIDDKRYISSKQAAKVTGYAKDYIGQLCREGRVPAQVVGRSWYVLESAIRDHRFGNEVIGVTREVEERQPSSITSGWQAPRYEAAVPAVLPQMERPRYQEEPAAIDLSEPVEQFEPVTQPENTWVSSNVSPIEAPPEEETGQYEDAVEVDQEPAYEAQEDDSKEPEQPEDLVLESVPMVRREEGSVRMPDMPLRPAAKRRSSARRLAYGLIRVVAPAIALIMLGLTAVNSGYLDKYLTSFSQASVITGYTIYEK